MITKAELETMYKVPVYVKWDKVPSKYTTRIRLKEKGILIPDNAKPDAIKGGGITNGNRYYLLFLESKYLNNEVENLENNKCL